MATPQLPTPVLLIDEQQLEANMDRAQAYADAQGVSLRPHAKTHKSPELAREQMARGAVGVCVAKLGEAEVFADAGITDIVMANTTYGRENAARAARLARRIRFQIGADHPDQLEQLAEEARSEGTVVDVRVEVDTGAGRGGRPPDEAAELVRLASGLRGVRPVGVYTYEGFTYSAGDLAELRETHLRAQRLLADVARRTAELYPGPPIVSVGSTPSLSVGIDLLPEITEIRPGTAIFFDAQQAALAGGLEHCAATVLATVVSSSSGRAIVDAGSKSLTSDGIRSGVLAVKGHGVVLETGGVVARLSEEHGVLEGAAADRLEIGRRVRIVPNHICPVVNLFDRLVVVRDGEIVRVLPVATRGRVD